MTFRAKRIEWMKRLSAWLCKHDMHAWTYTRLKALYPECGGAVACSFTRICDVCGKEESGADWF